MFQLSSFNKENFSIYRGAKKNIVCFSFMYFFIIFLFFVTFLFYFFLFSKLRRTLCVFLQFLPLSFFFFSA